MIAPSNRDTKDQGKYHSAIYLPTILNFYQIINYNTKIDHRLKENDI